MGPKKDKKQQQPVVKRVTRGKKRATSRSGSTEDDQRQRPQNSTADAYAQFQHRKQRNSAPGQSKSEEKVAYVDGNPVPISMNMQQFPAFFPQGILGLKNKQTRSPVFVKEDGSLELEVGATYVFEKQRTDTTTGTLKPGSLEATDASDTMITETGRKNGSGSSSTSQGDPWAKASSISQAEMMIDVSRIWEPRLTETRGMKVFVGRTGSLRQLDDHIRAIRKYFVGAKSETSPESVGEEDEAQPEWVERGQPLIGTGAASGVGKSRLLQEIRSQASQRGDVVITLTYNSLESLAPHAQEQSFDKATVVKAFLSRLVCMMFPKEEFAKIGNDCLWNQYSVSRGDVVRMMVKKFAGKNVLILGDEFVNLSTKLAAEGYDDRALDAVVSELGHLCAEVTSELGKNFCIGFFTALSQRIVDEAQTRSGRTILVVDLPLFSRDETLDLVSRAKHGLDSGIPEILFALTAGHARLLEAFLAANTLKWGTTTLEGIIPAVKNLARINPLKEEDVITVLAQRREDTEKLDLLCRRALVQKLDTGDSHYVAAPAMLYHWAAASRTDLGVQLKAFLDACWREIFLKNEKQGENGKPLEAVLSSYERLRRHWFSGEVKLGKFFKGSERRADFKWAGKSITFDTLQEEVPLENPKPKNMWKNFNRSILNDVNTLYKQEPGGNSPLYDWFTVVKVDGIGVVPLGSQCKHGGGEVKDPDSDVISVKLSTLASLDAGWKERGWLVLNGDALREYLGPALAAAAVCVLYHLKGPSAKIQK